MLQKPPQKTSEIKAPKKVPKQAVPLRRTRGKALEGVVHFRIVPLEVVPIPRKPTSQK